MPFWKTLPEIRRLEELLGKKRQTPTREVLEDIIFWEVSPRIVWQNMLGGRLQDSLWEIPSAAIFGLAGGYLPNSICLFFGENTARENNGLLFKNIYQSYSDI